MHVTEDSQSRDATAPSTLLTFAPAVSYTLLYLDSPGDLIRQIAFRPVAFFSFAHYPRPSLFLLCDIFVLCASADLLLDRQSRALG